MKIALIGYGKMGRTIEGFAVRRGHSVTIRIDKDNTEDIYSELFKSSDVAIEFSCPETAFHNVSTALKSGVPVVCGTTGWIDKLEEAKRLCNEQKTGFIYSSNFSLGVNIFFHINRKLAEIMKQYPDYVPTIEEIHHIHKKDAPSGTAITLAEDVLSHIGLKKWSLEKEENSLHISAVREGEVPGTHSVSYENSIDIIKISHEAKSRDGFALGAVIAAEFIKDRLGFFTMKEVLGLV
ncbi:MAG: 4-hydroxy-tetrahydrodipicolinate reductase [Prevotellaceae bacterium]|jgi:4-hydroxy-tetrahydrodipicolinate reductase|nr:4-hydroxy-tetrahydrodipicolinate reductase [Prevotellaceae bacterium]